MDLWPIKYKLESSDTCMASPRIQWAEITSIIHDNYRQDMKVEERDGYQLSVVFRKKAVTLFLSGRVLPYTFHRFIAVWRDGRIHFLLPGYNRGNFKSELTFIATSYSCTVRRRWMIMDLPVTARQAIRILMATGKKSTDPGRLHQGIQEGQWNSQESHSGC
jgi:hypothetical protein